MVDSQDTLLREVNEELRREQAVRFWRRYGTYIVIALALLLIGIFGFQQYQASNKRLAEAGGAKLLEAVRLIDGKKEAEARKLLDELKASGSPAYKTLAAWRDARLLAEGGKTAEAAVAFQTIANDEKADLLLRDLAVIKFASLKLDQSSFTETKNRLTDQAFDGRPWRTSARELIAIAAIKAGQKDEARQALEQIMGDRASPAAARERAGVLLGIVTAAEIGAQPTSVPVGGGATAAPSGTAPASGAAPSPKK